jgi:hypothetical protein
MTELARIKIASTVVVLTAALLAVLPVCSAQTAIPKKKPVPKPEPTAPELFEYVRSALLLLSPDDGVDDNQEVFFDQPTGVLTVTQPGGHCDQFFGALDANNAVWDEYDPSDNSHPRDKLLRLTLVSVSGKAARICYDKLNHVDESLQQNRIRLLFNETKADRWPDFQKKMARTLKKLIELSGGTPAKDLF